MSAYFHRIPEHIKDITGFEVVGTFAGSFGVRLERQVPQSGMVSGDTDPSLHSHHIFSERLLPLKRHSPFLFFAFVIQKVCAEVPKWNGIWRYRY